MKIIKKVFRFFGGVHPKDCKEYTSEKPIEELPLPNVLKVSMSQHLGAPALCIVNVGDVVSRGQIIGERNGFISVNVRAPVCGKVTAIEKSLGPSGSQAIAVSIEVDKDLTLQSMSKNILPPIDWQSASRDELLKRIEDAGICGMGGAGFPTVVKLNPPPGKKCDYLIVNGAECEPYLSADARTMIENADRLKLGVQIIRKILGNPEVKIAVEDNKPEAIKVLEKVFSDCDDEISLVVLPVKYPHGSEKHQIYATVGRVVPEPPALPIDVGCVVENVGTIAAIADAVEKGEPLLSRVTTVSGDAINNPKNVRAPIGTLYSDLVAFCGGEKVAPAKVISGGPMMGFTVASLNIATTKTTSGLLLLSSKSVFQYTSQACIHCGRCLRACPMKLNPALISKAMEADDCLSAENAHVMDCLECGACSFVCPAHRTITQFCRRAKNSIRARIAAEKAKAAAAAKEAGK